MRIVLGCDEARLPPLEVVRRLFATHAVGVVDVGVPSTGPVLFPNAALQVAYAVSAGDRDPGTLLCGTSIGMSITENQAPRCARRYVRSTPPCDLGRA